MQNIQSLSLLASHAQFALNMTEPLINKLIKELGRRTASVVMLKPGMPYEEEDELLENIVLAERIFGDQDRRKWAKDYHDLARCKARLCWRTGLSSRTVGERAPYLLQSGDTKYGGGVACDGMIVATSGLPQEIDEAISHAVIGLFWASVRRSREEVMANEHVDMIL